MNDIAFSMAAPLPGPAPEVAVSNDMIKRGLIVAPILIAVCGLIWGVNGAASSAYGIAIVLVNFALAAGIVAVTAKISLRLMMGAILFGYLVRLGLIFLAVYVVKDAGWISLPALGATIIFTHLGLLVWELKYVAMSLAYPGLKPKPRPSATPSPTQPGTREYLAMLALEFPPINELIRWRDIFPASTRSGSSPSSRRSSASSCSSLPAARIR